MISCKTLFSEAHFSLISKAPLHPTATSGLLHVACKTLHGLPFTTVAPATPLAHCALAILSSSPGPKQTKLFGSNAPS